MIEGVVTSGCDVSTTAMMRSEGWSHRDGVPELKALAHGGGSR
jgi:hypothetical protein